MRDKLVLTVLLDSESDCMNNVVVVTRERPDKSVDVTKVFVGEEAIELYNMLTCGKESK